MTRDDLFTHIHKGLRLGLFEITTMAGATDWNDPDAVRVLDARWRPLLALLRSHARHEDDHIFRLLEGRDPRALAGVAEQHGDLDDLLDHVAETFDAVVAHPDPAAGLALYRDLARFVAAYLPHLHEEETAVMARIWDLCTDNEIAATRAAFMAEITPAEQATTMELMLPALDRTTRHGLAATMAATAPPPVVDGILAIGDSVLPPADAEALRAAAGRAAVTV